MRSYPRFAETSGTIKAAAAILFDYLDDQASLSAHMSKSSGMLLVSTIDIYMESDHTSRRIPLWIYRACPWCPT